MKSFDSRTEVTRRSMLKAVGAGVAALTVPAIPALAAEKKEKAGSLRDKAKKNLKLGIFNGVYAGLPMEEALRRIKDDGFKGIVFDGTFKDVAFDPMKPDWDALKKMTTCIEKHDLQICGLFGYHNVVDPSPGHPTPGEVRMDLLIKEWKRFGSPIIATETGTFSTASEWTPDAKNYTEEGYQACRKAFERLARAAEKTGAVIAIEGYWKNVIDSAERAERLFKDVDSPSLKLTMDPNNYFRNEDLPKMKPMIEDIFKRIGKQTVIAHAKDVKAAEKGPEQPAAGRGQLDHNLYLRRLLDLNKELFLVVEHLTLDDVPRTRDFVLGQIEKL